MIIPRPPLRLSRPAIIIATLAVITAGIAIESHRGPPGGQPPAAEVLRSTDLVMQDHPDGSITVTQAGTGAFVTTVPPATNGFLRALLQGLVRERRLESIGSPSIPFRITRWSDGRLTIDDIATGRLIELEAFGHTNEDAFARLLDLSPPPATR